MYNIVELPGLLEEKYLEYSGHTGVVVVEGISGAGKSYQAELFLQEHADELFILRIVETELEPYEYEVFNNALFNLIPSDSDFLKEKDENGLPKILKEAIGAIPYTDTYLPNYLEGEDAITNQQLDVLDHRGKYIRRHSIPKLITLIEKLTGDRKICLYCDNIQLYDLPSFRVIMDLIHDKEKNRKKEWFILLLYTHNIHSPEIGHSRIEHELDRFTLMENIYSDRVEVEKCSENDIKAICQSIIDEVSKTTRFSMFAGQVAFTPEQHEHLYTYSGGIIYHMKLAICNLMAQGMICCMDGELTSPHDWGYGRAKECIEDPVKKSIDRIYRAEEHGKITLERASILGEAFYSVYLRDVFKLNHNVQEVLKIITEKYQILKPEKRGSRLKDWSFINRLHHGKVYDFIERVEGYHLEAANFLEKEKPDNYEEIERHLLVAGEEERALHVCIKKINHYLQKGLYKRAEKDFNILKDKFKSEKDSLTKKLLNENKDSVRNAYDLLEGKLLFHNRHYPEASLHFTSCLLGVDVSGSKRECHTSFEADCYHWRGKSRIKLDTREEFLKGIDDLITAQNFYCSSGDTDAEHEINSHLVVAYAHINEYKKSKECYDLALEYFEQTDIGRLQLCKLLRRCVLFSEHDLSARILKSSGQSLKDLGYLAEAIMSFNNSATQYMFVRDFTTAGILLDDALDISKDTDDFGVNYLNHNKAVLKCFEGADPEKALEDFATAKGKSNRKVDLLIIECNQYALRAGRGDLSVIPAMEVLLADAKKTGENEYIIHTTVNLAKMLLETGNLDRAYQLVEEVRPIMLESNSFYRFMVWYTVYSSCCELKELAIPQEVQERHKEVTEKPSQFKQPHLYFDYLLLTLQYWSEN